MAKKLQLVFNSPVILISSLITLLVFILQNTAIPNLIEIIASSNTASLTEQAFSPINPMHYVRLFTLIFGHYNMQTLCINLAIILLLGPRVEERFGTILVFIMFAITSFVAGILSVLFLENSICGLDGIALLLVILTLFECASLKEIYFSYIILLAVLIANTIVFSIQQNNFGILLHYAGSLCASLFGFLDYSEHKKKPRKKSKPQIQQNQQ